MQNEKYSIIAPPSATRAVYIFKDGTHLNLPANYITIQDEWAVAWQDDKMVAMARTEDIARFYLSEKKGSE